MAHTPGPWKVEHGCNVVSATGRSIATCGGYTNSQESSDVIAAENEANARLGAAAPDLRDALEDLVDLAEFAMRQANNDGGEFEIDDELADALAALAKAGGEER